MTIRKIGTQGWTQGLERLRGGYRLIGPVTQGRAHEFCELAAGQLPELDFLNTRLSAKGLIYPQTQTLFHFNLDSSQPDAHILQEAPRACGPQAVLGIRPCDADAFALVRRNFETAEYQDPYWLGALEASTLVGLACDKPCSSCFCTSAGSGPYSKANLDVLLVQQPEGFVAEGLTAKGEALLSAAGWSEDAPAGTAEWIATQRQAAEARVTSHIPTENLRDQAGTELYEAPFWEDVAFACINCGTCTYLCPTCWCFDIQDEAKGARGVRLRNWDSCMYPLFTLHGSGHNPRGVKVQRVRQRFMHKLKYYVDKYGNGIQCVGCGRCVRACPVNIDIRRVAERMNGFNRDACACRIG